MVWKKRKKQRQQIEFVSAEQAWEDLSRKCFAVWIFLHFLDLNKIRGQRKISEKIGLSKSQTERIIRELRLSKYIDVFIDSKKRSCLIFLKKIFNLKNEKN